MNSYIYDYDHLFGNKKGINEKDGTKNTNILWTELKKEKITNNDRVLIQKNKLFHGKKQKKTSANKKSFHKTNPTKT